MYEDSAMRCIRDKDLADRVGGDAPGTGEVRPPEAGHEFAVLGEYFNVPRPSIGHGEIPASRDDRHIPRIHQSMLPLRADLPLERPVFVEHFQFFVDIVDQNEPVLGGHGHRGRFAAFLVARNARLEG